jgi:hypothetical protein
MRYGYVESIVKKKTPYFVIIRISCYNNLYFIIRFLVYLFIKVINTKIDIMRHNFMVFINLTPLKTHRKNYLHSFFIDKIITQFLIFEFSLFTHYK